MDRLWTWTLSDVFYLVASLMVVWVGPACLGHIQKPALATSKKAG
jgi:hypothetical protein